MHLSTASDVESGRIRRYLEYRLFSIHGYIFRINHNYGSRRIIFLDDKPQLGL